MFGLVEPGKKLRRSLEPHESRPVARDLFRKHFDRYFAVELCIPGTIDLAHTAHTQRREDFVDT